MIKVIFEIFVYSMATYMGSCCFYMVFCIRRHSKVMGPLQRLHKEIHNDPELSYDGKISRGLIVLDLIGQELARHGRDLADMWIPWKWFSNPVDKKLVLHSNRDYVEREIEKIVEEISSKSRSADSTLN